MAAFNHCCEGKGEGRKPLLAAAAAAAEEKAVVVAVVVVVGVEEVVVVRTLWRLDSSSVILCGALMWVVDKWLWSQTRGRKGETGSCDDGIW